MSTFPVTPQMRRLCLCEISEDLITTVCKNEVGGTCSTYGGKKYTGFWWGNLRERDHLGDPCADERIILRSIFRKWVVAVRTGSSWLGIGAGGVHF